MSKKNEKLIYVATIGILAYIISDIIHELIGHALSCLILGNKIELLTNVYFKSSPGNIFVDICGPIANLIFGILAFYLLKKTSIAKLFLFQVSAFNLFWFCGTIVQSTFGKIEDWTFAMKEISNEPFSRILLISLGILAYIAAFYLLNFYLKDAGKLNKLITKNNIFFSFLVALCSAFVAGLFFDNGRLNSAFNSSLEMVASIPILFLSFKKNNFEDDDKRRLNYFLRLTIILIYFIFCLTLGKGIIK